MNDFSPPYRILPADGATIGIGPDGVFVIVQLSDIVADEVNALRKGKLEVAILSEGSTGFALISVHFLTGTKPPIVFEMPFHIGLLAADRRHLPEPEAGLGYSMMIMIQDQVGRQHGGRLLGLTEPLCQALEKLVHRQAKDAADPRWTERTHHADVEEFSRRFPDVGRVADRLFTRALARDTFH